MHTTRVCLGQAQQGYTPSHLQLCVLVTDGDALLRNVVAQVLLQGVLCIRFVQRCSHLPHVFVIKCCVLCLQLGDTGPGLSSSRELGEWVCGVRA
jgi:hypothetical protein